MDNDVIDKESDDEDDSYYYEINQKSAKSNGDKSDVVEDISIVGDQKSCISIKNDNVEVKDITFRKRPLKTKDAAVETNDLVPLTNPVNACLNCQKPIDKTNLFSESHEDIRYKKSDNILDKKPVVSSKRIIIKFIIKVVFCCAILVALSVAYVHSIQNIKWKKEILIPNLLSCGLVVLGCLKLLSINIYHAVEFGCLFSVYDYSIAIIISTSSSLEWIFFCLDFHSIFVNVIILSTTSSIAIFMKCTGGDEWIDQFLQKFSFGIQIVTCYFTPIIPHQMATFNKYFVIIFFLFWLSIFMVIYITSTIASSLGNYRIHASNEINSNLYQSMKVYHCIFYVFSVIQFMDLSEIKNILDLNEY